MIPKLKLYIPIVVSMLCWSISFIWTQVAMESFTPVTLISLRLILASLLLFLFCFLTKKLQPIKRKDIKLFILLAFFEPYLYYIGETYGLTMVAPTLASVIVSTIPLFAPFAAFFFLKEKISFNNVLGIIISLLGVCFVVYQHSTVSDTSFKGVLLLFFAVVAAICYNMILRKIPNYYSSLNIILYQSLFGLIFFIPTFVFTDLKHIGTLSVTINALSALFTLAVFASVLGFVLYVGTVRKIGVAKSNVFSNLIPVFTAIFSWLILNENLSAIKWIGIAIVIAGLFMSQLSYKKKIST